MGFHITKNQQQTINLGKQLGKTLCGGEIIAFTGGLGAGKTTFCRGIAKGLNCLDDVSSPTFAIVNYYRGKIPFAHFDAYRISSEDDLETSGFYDYHEAGAVIAIEWSENVIGFLVEPLIYINIKHVSNEERQIEIKGAHNF